ncbi:MAG: hypothetical protein V1656_00025 [Candidatus Jorgensenbacteria bacterium]
MVQKDSFFRFYANLPIPIRKQVVLDLKEEGGPITWEVAYREINGDTLLGEKILGKLIELKFVPSDK